MNNLLVQQDLEEKREEFIVDSLEGATWAFRKLRAINEKKNEINDVADAELERVQQWKNNEMNKLANDEEYFKGIIEAYYRKERQANPKFKISTPYGKVVTRKSKSWNYENEEETLSWIKNNELPYVKVKESIDKVELKKAFKDGVNTETGEVIPGVSVNEIESITIKAE